MKKTKSNVVVEALVGADRSVAPRAAKERPFAGPRARVASRVFMSALLLLSLVLITGCGKGLTEVTGKVTVDGRTVPGLEVRFEPKDPSIGTTATGYTQADGTYRLHYPGDKTGVPPGEYVVRITPSENEEATGKQLRIPIRYNTQSELTATVKAGDPNTIDFEISTK